MATVSLPGGGYGNTFIDALVYGGSKWSGTIKIWWGDADDVDAAGDRRGEEPAVTLQTWEQREIDAFLKAMASYAAVCGIDYTIADSAADADIVWWKADLGDEDAAHDGPRADQTWGFFNSNAAAWHDFTLGGDGQNLITQAVGVGLGLAVADWASTDADGVGFPTGEPLFTWNQGIWTVMASGDTGHEGSWHLDGSYGAQSGPGALDIAALQKIYGPNATAHAGADVYALPLANGPGVGWTSIWDTGGIDTISGEGSSDRVSIDLRAATLAVGDHNAGGYISKGFNVSGGFTIAAGTVIENAVGGNNGDDLQGNAAGNTMRGNAGKDKIWGEAGADVLFGGAGTDSLYGGADNDILLGGDDDDYMNGGDGNDMLDGESGWDFMFGGAGTDAMIGGIGQDIMYGEDGNDNLSGGIEIDKLWGGSGNDVVTGGTESDYLYGEDGDDRLNGDADNDYLIGGGGGDSLSGGIGVDYLRGNDGNDTLFGGANSDQLYGDKGKDIFVLDSKPLKDAGDKILDFDVRDDTIRLSKSFYKIKANALAKAFYKGVHAHDADDRVIYNPKNGTLLYDSDGTGSRAEIVIAKLPKKLLFTYHDLTIG
jgi:serralysin